MNVYKYIANVMSHTSYIYMPIMSHRSGETTDTFIVDAAVALDIPFVKMGSVSHENSFNIDHQILYSEHRV